MCAWLVVCIRVVGSWLITNINVESAKVHRMEQQAVCSSCLRSRAAHVGPNTADGTPGRVVATTICIDLTTTYIA